MPYITLAKLKAGLPIEITDKLLDDDGSGVAPSDNWTAIATSVQDEIDGRIGQRYAVPFADPVPAVIANAAFVLAAELVYQRRGFFNDGNPWTARAQGIRGSAGTPGGQPGLLDKIASGDEPLTPSTARAKPSGAAFIEQSKLSPSRSSSTGAGNNLT
jgi:hypothetical protein